MIRRRSSVVLDYPPRLSKARWLALGLRARACFVGRGHGSMVGGEQRND